MFKIVENVSEVIEWVEKQRESVFFASFWVFVGRFWVTEGGGKGGFGSAREEGVTRSVGRNFRNISKFSKVLKMVGNVSEVIERVEKR